MKHLVLILALLAACPAAFAAEAEAPAPEKDAPAAGAPAEEEIEAPVEEKIEAAEEEGGNEGEGGQEETSVAVTTEDFIPSAQISEDLSVSFPVDI